MYILFKRHGQRRFFKRYESLSDLNVEINKGHNEKFKGNNQFYYNIETREIQILNPRLSVLNCEECLESANIIKNELSA